MFADLAREAPPRFVTRLNRDNLGIIIACDAPYYCRSWPQPEPIPPRWVEATTDPLTLDTLDTSVCDLSTVEIEIPPYLDGAVRVISPRAARPPRVPRAKRPPRPPRAGRRGRSPRRPRTPRAPRPPREPREPRTNRAVARLGRGWAGWPQAHQEAIGFGATDPGPLPRGDWTCIIDYLDRMAGWSELVTSLGTDDKVVSYLKQRFGESGVCIGGPRTACEIFADNIAEIIKTADQMIQGKAPVAKPGKPRLPPGRRRISPGPAIREDLKRGIAAAPFPTREDGSWIYWYFAPIATSVCPSNIPTGTVLRLTFPTSPVDIGCNNQWSGRGPGYEGPYYDAD
jgi:hypothetical protein